MSRGNLALDALCPYGVNKKCGKLGAHTNIWIMGFKQAGYIKQVDCSQEQREGRLMYKSAVEALEAVVGSECSGRISKIPSELSLMGNGIEYCFVEVTCPTGGQYGIEAFGQEARDLYATALSIKERQESMAAVPLLVAGSG